jgi:hypothetical protein
MRNLICPRECPGCWYGWLTTFGLLCIAAELLACLIVVLSR